MVKAKRFLSVLATAIILAMLIAVIPVAPALAAESVTLDPNSGEIGDEIDIDGSGFDEEETVYFFFSSDNASVGEEIDTDVDTYYVVLEIESDDAGEISDSFDVPDELTDGDDDEDVEDGTYYVYATYDDGEEIITRDTFTVEGGGGGTGDESISVTPTSVSIDDYVEIEGTHFDDNSTVWFYFSKESASVGDEIDNDVVNYEKVEAADANSSGYVTGHFDVPEVLTDGEDDEDVVGGTYYVYATYEDDDEIVAKDNITIIATELSISPTKGTVGTEVEITGSGFDDNKSITIKFGGSTVAISEGDDETSSSGAFTSSILVPEIAKGSYSITVTVGSDTATAEDKFTVEPKIVISPQEGGVNDRVIVTGTGFAQNDDISITFDGVTVTTGESDSYGSFDAPFNVPEVTPGTYKVEADTAEASFTISTSVSISPTTTLNSPGYVGDEVTISGTGFKANSEITITFESTPAVVATTQSDSGGAFSATFEVPTIPLSDYSTSGEHTITASDGTSSVPKKFYVELTPPEIPQPQRPYMGGKAGSKAYFDWDDVATDIDGQPEKSTPITYDLQVATDENFTDIVLDIKNIETSEYTLTADEALESTSDETPYYYWRVRAVDAASNASQWTGAGKFKVGFTFSFPGLSGWVLYVLIGVGAVVLFFVGLWVGRRSGGGDYY